jgi:hypothetical protein
MNIDSSVIFFRVARIVRLALVTGLLTGSTGMAQLPISFTPGNPPPVLGGSVIPFNHGTSGSWGRIDAIAESPNGNVLFLDAQQSIIYRLAPGASEPTVVVSAGQGSEGNNGCATLENGASTFWNGGMAFDSANNLYVGNRYSGIAQYCRYPYDSSTNSWDINAADYWNSSPSIPSATINGTVTVLKPQALYITHGSQPDCSIVPVGPTCTDTVYISTSGQGATPSIYSMSLNVATGVWSNMTPIITGLEVMVPNFAVDQAGNVYFVENVYGGVPVNGRINGILEIPAGTTGLAADGSGSEATLVNIIGASNNFTGIGGITLDAHGNLYFASASNPPDGYVDGLFMIPNEGTPTNPNLNWNDTVMIAPVKAGEQPFVDPRGFVWISTTLTTNWSPIGTLAPTCDTTTTQTIDATCLTEVIVIWKPGMANLASATVSGGIPVQITGYSVAAAGGTVTLTANNSLTENQVVTIAVTNSSDPLYPLNGLSFYVLGTSLSSTQFSVTIPTVTTTPGYLAGGASGATSATANLTPYSTVYYSFNQPTTPGTGSFVPSSKNFTVVPNPTPGNLPTGASFTSVPACTAGTTYPAWDPTEETSSNPTSDYSWCALYLELNTQGPSLAGSEVQILNPSGKVISGSNVYLSGVGQGAAISNLTTPAVSTIASGLSQPKQVAADSQGDTYVADAGLKAIEFYAAGSTVAKALGNSLSAPTGVAVDLAGDLYIGDAGNVYEIPYISGKLQTSQQTKIASGLGSHLNLAVDAWGDVLVADQTNKHVVEISNPQSALLQQGLQTLGSNANFTGPSAITTDNSGNVWVADGTNLWEITMPFGGATEVTSQLPTGVTGLAVDPSGSVFVTSASGVLWIPYQVNSTSAGLNLAAEVTVASGLGSAPIGVALDGLENVYVDYGSGNTAGLSQLSFNGAINFNTFLNQETNPAVPYEADAQLFNLGNSPLTLADFSTDTITQPNAGEFAIIPASNPPACSSSASISPGDSCYLGLNLLDALTPPLGLGQTNATATVLSNAANAASGLNIALSTKIIQDFRFTTNMTVTILPNTTAAGCEGSVYPGCQTVTVTVASTAGTPQGPVILKVPGSGVAQEQQTATLNSSGVATFQLSNLSGGPYNILATYGGEGTEGSSAGSCSPSGSVCFAGSAYKSSPSFTISHATPSFMVGPPGTAGCLSWTATNCTPNPGYVTSYLGTNFVYLASSTWFTASATAALGQPTGSVSFLANGIPVDPLQPQNSLTSNGDAEFSLVNLPLGVYSITAQYNGDKNFLSESFTIPAFQVINPSIEITATPSTVSTPAGTAVTATLTLMPLVGFSQDVSLECVSATLPQYAECTFAYPNSGAGTVTVGATGATPSTVVVTISSNVPVNSGTALIARQAPWALAGLFGLGLLGVIAGRKRLNRYLNMACLAVMFLGAFMAVTSCTNAGYSTPPHAPIVTTPPGLYNVQIISYNPSTLQQNSLTTPVFTLPLTIQ